MSRCVWSILILLTIPFAVLSCSGTGETPSDPSAPVPVPPAAPAPASSPAPPGSSSPAPEPVEEPSGEIPPATEPATEPAPAPTSPPARPPRPTAAPEATPVPTTPAPTPAPTVAPTPRPTAAPTPPAPTPSATPPPPPAATPSATPPPPPPTGVIEVAPTKDGLTRIGAEKCKICHRVQYDSWAAGSHAARKPPLDCESCHGPGSEYKTMSVMKDPEKARQAGLVMPAASFCTENCHATDWQDEMLAQAHAHKGD